ncbi:MAG TPA: amidohydrolase family protein [Candidatus Binataceae bacterium]|jgi:predicted TIM-barrel fold metal-dependent hydrolase
MKSHGVIDADSHVFEPQAIWTEYLESDYRFAARSAFSYHDDGAGHFAVILNGKPAPWLNHSMLNRHALWHPGLTPEAIGAMDPAHQGELNPGAYDAKQRLRDMDAMKIERAVLFPTLFAEYFPLAENPDIAYALARAYNDWMLDFCRGSSDRLIPVAILPMQDPIFAGQELRRVAKAGFKACFIRPSFFDGRFLNHPSYDPVWEEIERLGLTACIHPAAGITNPQWTSEGSFVERVAGNLRIGHPIAESVSYFMDNAAALTTFAFCGHMERYPKLKLAFMHGGISWLPLALEKAETYLTFFMIENVCLEPERFFYDRPYLVGFNPWERSVAKLYDVVENVACWGSHYPAHDTMEPAQSAGQLSNLKVPESVIAKFMGDNAGRILGLD